MGAEIPSDRKNGRCAVRPPSNKRDWPGRRKRSSPQAGEATCCRLANSRCAACDERDPIFKIHRHRSPADSIAVHEPFSMNWPQGSIRSCLRGSMRSPQADPFIKDRNLFLWRMAKASLIRTLTNHARKPPSCSRDGTLRGIDRMQLCTASSASM
jgi:hypothetical protein